MAYNSSHRLHPLCNIDLYLNVLGGRVSILLLPVAILGSLLSFIMVYAFPLLAVFDNRVKDIIKNSVVIAIAYMPYTLMVIGIIAGLFMIVYYFYLPIILFVPSLTFVLSAYPLNKVFKILMRKKAEQVKS